MIDFAVNHMTVPGLTSRALLEAAATLGCVGVEFRNDLPGALFEGRDPAAVAEDAARTGQRILALAEVKRFNDFSDKTRAEAEALCKIARAAGAEGISLIPRNDGEGLGNGERQANLRLALREIKPLLETYGLKGFVEPLGFEICALRTKSEAVDAIVGVGGESVYRLVHDTFHHHLSGETAYFAALTGMVHISGVTDPYVTVNRMTDAHRVLVDGADRLGNIDQIARLFADGYRGPVSFEPFSPLVHTLADPVAGLGVSMQFIRDRVLARAA